MIGGGGNPWASVKASWGDKPDRPRDRWDRLWIVFIVLVLIVAGLDMAMGPGALR